MDRGKCGTALHLACDARAMPLGVVVTGANANDGCQTEDVLQALVVQPPVAEFPGPVSRPARLTAGAGRWGLWQWPDARNGPDGRGFVC